jgi:hypothetical protein
MTLDTVLLGLIGVLLGLLLWLVLRLKRKPHLTNTATRRDQASDTPSEAKGIPVSQPEPSSRKTKPPPQPRPHGMIPRRQEAPPASLTPEQISSVHEPIQPPEQGPSPKTNEPSMDEILASIRAELARKEAPLGKPHDDQPRDELEPPPVMKARSKVSIDLFRPLRMVDEKVEELEAQWIKMEGPSNTPVGDDHPTIEACLREDIAPFADDQPIRDNVECSVFAPANPTKGRRILIQALLHKADQFAAAIRIAMEIDKGANRKAFAKLSTQVEHGALVQLFLEIPRLNIETPFQEVTWEGVPVRVAYPVDVPPTAPVGPCQGTLRVMVEDFPVGEIIFGINIGEREEPATYYTVMGPTGQNEDRRIDPIAIEAIRFRHAFISYSRKDAQPVLLYAEGLARGGIKVLVDVHSIEPGAEWQEQIPGFIDKSDLFCLMWSQNAAQSEWVDKEARIAVHYYDKKRAPRIWPVVIEHPAPEPPSHLKRFNFNSPWLAHRVAQKHSLFKEQPSHPDPK